MRWFLRISLIAGVLLVAYTAWPFIDLYRLSSALERGDTRELEKRVSFAAVRHSVARQVLDTYVALTGEDAKVGRFTRDLALGASTPIVGGIVGDNITPEGLPELFWPEEVERARTGGLKLAPMDIGNAWAIYAASEYRGKDFHTAVPPTRPKERRYRIRLRLTQWKWRLIDVQLPHDVRIKLAQVLIKAREKRQ
jgi:hypothetical protein